MSSPLELRVAVAAAPKAVGRDSGEVLMTTTTIDSPTLDSSSPEPAETRPIPAPSLPARLLDETSDGAATNASRVGIGVLGLGALTSLPSLGCQLVSTAPRELLGPPFLFFAIDLLWLPVVGALTLALPVPGLSILLSVVNRGIEPARLVNAVSRAYYRMGLLGAGLTPSLLLYALTGASADWVEVGTALAYLGSMGLALSVLLGELRRALPREAVGGAMVIFGWAAFVAVFGIHLFDRFNVSP
jgi:hypothetical protein